MYHYISLICASSLHALCRLFKSIYSLGQRNRSCQNVSNVCSCFSLNKVYNDFVWAYASRSLHRPTWSPKCEAHIPMAPLIPNVNPMLPKMQVAHSRGLPWPPKWTPCPLNLIPQLQVVRYKSIRKLQWAPLIPKMRVMRCKSIRTSQWVPLIPNIHRRLKFSCKAINSTIYTYIHRLQYLYAGSCNNV